MNHREEEEAEGPLLGGLDGDVGWALRVECQTAASAACYLCEHGSASVSVGKMSAEECSRVTTGFKSGTRS